jgi:hypothetical protein
MKICTALIKTAGLKTLPTLAGGTGISILHAQHNFDIGKS